MLIPPLDLFLYIFVVGPVGGCPDGWYKLRDMCYKLGGGPDDPTNLQTWYAARETCSTDGPNGHLACIENNGLQGKCWIWEGCLTKGKSWMTQPICKPGIQQRKPAQQTDPIDMRRPSLISVGFERDSYPKTNHGWPNQSANLDIWRPLLRPTLITLPTLDICINFSTKNK